jgi:hypothetical protein
MNDISDLRVPWHNLDKSHGEETYRFRAGICLLARLEGPSSECSSVLCTDSSIYVSERSYPEREDNGNQLETDAIIQGNSWSFLLTDRNIQIAHL